MCAHHVHKWSDPLELELQTPRFEPPYECQESNLGPLEELPILLTSDPFLSRVVRTTSNFLTWWKGG